MYNYKSKYHRTKVIYVYVYFFLSFIPSFLMSFTFVVLYHYLFVNSASTKL